MIIFDCLLLLMWLQWQFCVFDSKNNVIRITISFNSTLQLINGISHDCQKLLTYLCGTVIVTLFRIVLFPSATVFPNNFALYFKDLKLLLLFPISGSKVLLHLQNKTINYLLCHNNWNYVVPSISVMHLINGAQILNAAGVKLLYAQKMIISP